MELTINLKDPRILNHNLTISEIVFLNAFEQIEEESRLSMMYLIFQEAGFNRDTIYRNYKRLKEKNLIELNFKRGSNLYVVADIDKSVLKIGSSNNVSARIDKLKTGNHLKLELIFNFEGLGQFEREIHKIFSQLRLSGEWFKYDAQIISFFKNEIQHKYKSVSNN